MRHREGDRRDMARRAFQGPNGWYVADEGADGSHYQPSDGGHLTKREAHELAAQPDEDVDDPWYPEAD